MERRRRRMDREGWMEGRGGGWIENRRRRMEREDERERE